MSIHIQPVEISGNIQTVGVFMESVAAPQNDLAQRAFAEVRHRWIRPAKPAQPFKVAADEVERVATAALDAMLVRDFRVTPYPLDEEYVQLLARVKHWVERGLPIRIRLGYAPMKNPRTVSHTTADWAEFFAFCHLAAWHNKVCSVYPPGLRIRIVFDDSTVRMANRYAKAPMKDYMGSVARLIPAMGYQSFLVGTMRQSLFAWLFNFGLYQWAGWRVRRWERNPANAATLARMLEFSRRNLMLPAELEEAEKDRRYQAAAHRYRVYWEALQLSGLSRRGNSLIAMYLDGYQHHIRQFAALHLRSVGKQQGTQPWQGEGALLDNGVGKLVPVVITAKRREDLTCQTVAMPKVLDLPNFDAIAIGQESRVGRAA